MNTGHQRGLEVAELSEVFTTGEDFLLPAIRMECEQIIPNVDTIKTEEASDAYLFLKSRFVGQSV